MEGWPTVSQHKEPLWMRASSQNRRDVKSDQELGVHSSQARSFYHRPTVSLFMALLSRFKLVGFRIQRRYTSLRNKRSTHWCHINGESTELHWGLGSIYTIGEKSPVSAVSQVHSFPPSIMWTRVFCEQAFSMRVCVCLCVVGVL